MVTEVLAWLTVLAVCVAAVLFGQTVRTAPRRRPRSPAGRLGLFLALSGPWLVLVAAAAAGALTGGWIVAAAAGAGGIVAVEAAGYLLAAR